MMEEHLGCDIKYYRNKPMNLTGSCVHEQSEMNIMDLYLLHILGISFTTKQKLVGNLYKNRPTNCQIWDLVHEHDSTQKWILGSPGSLGWNMEISKENDGNQHKIGILKAIILIVDV